MLIKVFSLKFDALMGGFDDAPIREFSQDKEILQIRDHLLLRNEIPYLVLVIKYYPFRKEAQESTPSQPEGRPSESWRKDLGDANLPLFNQLRDWRSERCKKDGVPPYLLFTNAQLASIAKLKPQTLADLATIEGVGRGKIDRYGADVLEITVTKDGTAPVATVTPQSDAKSDGDDRSNA